MGNNQLELPAGLRSTATQQLQRHREEVSCDNFHHYLELAREHLANVHRLAPEKPTINVALAEAITATFERLHTVWETLTSDSREWLCAAMCYFAEPADADEHDFESYLGFEDDVEVLNACLARAGLAEWQLNPAHYD